jgi:beta-glucosidase-like glycosyl hydrolase
VSALLGRLLFPAIRWDPARGFDGALEQARRDLELGPGGFVIFGGTAAAVVQLAAELRRSADRPLLLAADLERGAGQQFSGATQLPPAAALGAIDDLAVTRAAAKLTAREARALGIDWIYAPVADLDVEPRNPIVGTRSFGADPARVAAHVAAWVWGCREAGALACVKHFPGHGRTTVDSHATLPRVEADRATLQRDLEPFTAAIAAGVDAVMSAHVAYPALDDSGMPATLSHPIVTELLRGELGFGGLVATDALIMEAARPGNGEAAVVQAVAAGCDVLLYPADPAAALAELTSAQDRAWPAVRAEEAARRIDAAAGAAAARREVDQHGRGASDPESRAPVAAGLRAPAGSGAAHERVGSHADRSWAENLARRSLQMLRGPLPALKGGVIDLFSVDDDMGGPYPAPSREPLVDALRRRGFRVREHDAKRSGPGVHTTVEAAEAGWDGGGAAGPDGSAAAGPDGSGAAVPDGSGAAVLAVYADVRAWKGRVGLGDAARQAVAGLLARRPDAAVVLFGHPRIAAELPGAVLVAWGGEAVMQAAAADALAGRAGTVATS